MTRDSLLTFYTQRLEHFREAIRRRTRTINLVALFRLVTLAAAIYLLVAGISGQRMLFYILSATGGGAFILLVLWFNRLKESRDLLRHLEDLNETELACLDHRFHHLPEGNEFADPSHPWSHDLDIFAKGSLYQYLNRASTPGGKAILARMLTTEPEGAIEILQRQGIVEDLKERCDFRQDYSARARLIRETEGDLEDISRWLQSDAYITRNRWLFYLALIIGALSLGIIVSGILGLSGFRLLLPVLFFNWIVLSPFFVRTNHYQSAISRKHSLLEGYAALLKIIAGSGSVHPGLTDDRELAEHGNREVERLSRLLNLFDQRLNMLLGVVFNSLFLFDFIMLHLLERWKRRNRESVPGWIELTGLTEAMISLAGFAFNHPGYVFPDMGERAADDPPADRESERISEVSSTNVAGAMPTGAGFVLRGIGHPLIPDGKRVLNDLMIEGEKVVIITGANMAGKSTFLRSLGVNMVLAYAGCPVFAREFRIPFMGLHSSMRTADSLAEEESYFLAEIKRLQQIVSRMESHQPMMILLDEVLKGTNTTDKKKGSVGLIRRALGYPVRIFIATHDLSLGEMEQDHPGAIVNYCFESSIREMELSFDYVIHRGIATSMNASFLMKKMGIMD